MKKLLCVLLAVLLLPALALAENEITFDESTVANLEGEFTALEDFGLMFYLPAVLQAQAVDCREGSTRQLLEVAGRKEVGMMVPLVFLILPFTVAIAVFPGLMVLQAGF